MEFRVGLATAVFACGLSSAAHAQEFVLDQHQFFWTGNVAHISATSHAVQSFQSSAGNIAEAGFLFTDIAGPPLPSFEIGLWDALPNALGAHLLASGGMPAHTFTDGSIISTSYLYAYWTPVPILAGTTYYLSIDVADDAFSVDLGGAVHSNPYADGELYVLDADSGGAYLPQPSDLTFLTYMFVPREIPEPATWALITLAFAGTGTVMRRRRHLLRIRST